MGWSVKDIPDQTGKLAVVTGANTGLGYETALELAASGAQVVVGARNQERGKAAVERILSLHPGAKVRFESLNLADLEDVAAFSSRIKGQCDRLDLLVNNAGVMSPPQRLATKDGFELQFGVNYLAHYALTAQLLPELRAASSPRVVNLSSGAHHTGKIQFEDLQSKSRYRPWPSYSQSKLAMLMFAFELQRQSDRHGWGLLSNAAHPGYARTELIPNGPGLDSPFARISVALLQPWMSQTAADGALPTLYAATAPEAEPGGYYGPDGFFEMKGAPKEAGIARQARDRIVAAKLWQVSGELTGVSFPG